jgi:glycosyltransferase involved in cell wall biosynthesis
VKLRGKNIVIISPERWGTNFVSKHHYALELAKADNTVYFLNPPNLGHKKIEVFNEEKNVNLFIVSYTPLMRGLNHLPVSISDRIGKLDIARIKKAIGLTSLDVVWSFDPYRFQNQKNWDAKISIYHPVDVHENQSLEKRVSTSSDLIFASSDQILQRISHKKKYKINHGLAAHFIEFKQEGFILPEGRGKYKVGYVGNLSYRFLDQEMLLNIITHNPSIDFYFIGPNGKSNLSSEGGTDFISNMSRLENVFILGPKKSTELPSYLALFDLFIMCYKGDEYKAELANPHKILEYLSTGKVVVSHYIDEFKDKEDLIRMANRNEEIYQLFNETIDHLSLFNSDDLAYKRKEYAQGNSYQKQLEKIEVILQSYA